MSTKPQTQPPSSFPAGVQPLSVAQAAELVGVSEQALRKRIRKGTLPAHKLRRGNQIVTVLAAPDLLQAYPQSAARLGTLAQASQPLSQPPSGAPGGSSGSAAHEGANGDGAAAEAGARLRESLATAVAARAAADERCVAAEQRAERAEEKLERALVQRGDEIAKTRKDAEQQAMQMAMEIARAQIQALPEASAETSPVRRRWLIGLLIGVLLVSVTAVVWGFLVWGELGNSRRQSDALTTQAAELQERAAGFLERAVEAETTQLVVREEALQSQLAVAEERLAWEAKERGLRGDLAQEQSLSQALRGELRLAHGLRRARINLGLAARMLQQIYQH